MSAVSKVSAPHSQALKLSSFPEQRNPKSSPYKGGSALPKTMTVRSCRRLRVLIRHSVYTKLFFEIHSIKTLTKHKFSLKCSVAKGVLLSGQPAWGKHTSSAEDIL